MTEDFSAIIFHHRSIKLSDLPDKRDEKQLYIYFNVESQARFIRPEFKSLKNFFNLSMTFRLNADFPILYGEFVQVADHPSPGHDLDMIINNFGAANTQLAGRENGIALLNCSESDLTNWPPGFCELRVVMQTERGDVRGRSPQSSVISSSPF